MTPTDPRRRMLPIVAMALFIDSMGIGIIIPVAPQLVMNLSGLTLADAAPIAGWLTLAYASMQFVFSPILGNLSDRHGRKPILLASLAALAVDYVLMGFAPTLTWLFIGRIIAGIAGATFATANAVVADIIPPDQRAKYFGLNGAAWGMGFIVGPVVGGLLGQYGPRVPFSVHRAQFPDCPCRTQRNPARGQPPCVFCPTRERARRPALDARDSGRPLVAGGAVHVPDRSRHPAIHVGLDDHGEIRLG
jgi:multidrug resistance protein